jgi:2-polyprenyl-6-hydroxyphenyl methylase/3-demethylubiquinone-9 3-methyltransferase
MQTAISVSGQDRPASEGDVRFPFGRNWASFLRVLDDSRIVEAERSLQTMLGASHIAGSTFLDIGCGSGLFSLAAMRLGAKRVHSLDADADSVNCARELKRRYFPDAAHWTIEQASALDAEHLATLGTWDIVYSWGVLHHTGRMWDALGLVAPLVRPGGLLFISIYNDQGWVSDWWTLIKRLYNTGWLGKAAVLSVFVPYYIIRGFIADLVRGRNPISRYNAYRTSRGMSMLHDWNDWLGGYPFEVAKPEAIFEFYRGRGFLLEKLTTCGGRLGCNEFVLRSPRVAEDVQ